MKFLLQMKILTFLNLDSKMDVKQINKIIEQTYCKKVEDALLDKNLLPEYQNCTSVQRKLETLINIMLEEDIDINKINNVMRKAILEIVPPGTKGVIKGNMFNKFVKEKVQSITLPEHFEIAFEHQHPLFECCEVPDFYIYDPKAKKLLIGMNQIDLWGGGHQSNRASKYVSDDRFHKYYRDDGLEIHLVSVVCNKVEIRSNQTKLFHLFQTGFEKNRLCYINGIETIIQWFFASSIVADQRSSLEMNSKPISN